MNNDIADIISQMTPGQLKEFINEDLPRLVGRMFWYHGQTDDDKKKVAIEELSKAIANPTMEATQESVIGSLRKYVSPEVEQPQQSRSANVTGYSFDDDSYNAIAGEYDDYDTYDDRVPSTRNQGSTIQSQVSQLPLDIEGVRIAIEQDPNWQPRNDYEKWAAGFLQGAEWTPNPTIAPVNVNRTAGGLTPKAPNEKYQFNVLEDRENKAANVKNVPIPKPVGVRTDLQTGLVYDYNRGLVFNPATGVTQKLISGGRTIPTKLEVPTLIQGEQSNFVPVPAQQIQEPHEVGYYSPVNPDASLIPNRQLTPEELSKGWGKLIASGKPISPPEYSDLSPQARQYLVDRQRNRDREQAYIQQQQAVDNQLTSGENRFFGTANFSPKRDYSIPDEYKRFIGTSPRIAQVNQAYSPEVISRVGQGGFLNNTGSILLPQTWIDKETGDTVFSRGRGIATTIVYKNDGKGGVIPMLSIPKADGMGNDLIELNDAVTRNIISPVDGKRIIGGNDGQEILSPIENKAIGTRKLITLGQLKAAKDIAAQTRFIPASGMDSFNRENVKLYEATDNSGKNYRATYMNPLTKEVFNVTQNGSFYLVRPGVSDEASGLPIRKGTTNLAQEMTDINRGMREGGRDNLVDIIREDPDNPGLEAFTRPVPAINPITGETINKYVHSELIERFNPTTGQIEKTYLPSGNLVNPDTLQPEAIQAGVDYSQYAVLDKDGRPIPKDGFIEVWDKTLGTPRPSNVQLLGKASKDVFKPVARRWSDENNPEDLFNYFNANVEGSGQSMEALDLARGGRRTAGIRKAPAYITNPNYVEGRKYPITYTDSDGNIRQIEVEGSPVLSGLGGRQETTIFNSGNPITAFAPTGYQNPNATPAYPSLQETDYLGGRLGFNAEGNIVDTEVIQSNDVSVQPNLYVKHTLDADNNLAYEIDYDQKIEYDQKSVGLDYYIPYEPNTNTESRVARIPLPEVPKEINNFTPSSEFYTNTSQLVRDTRTGKVIYDPNRTVYVRAAQDWYDDGDFAVVPYKEDKRIAKVNQVVPSSSVLPVYSYPYQEGDNSSITLFNPLLGEKPKEQAVVVGKNSGYTLPEIKSYQAEEVYPGDFTNTQFYRFRTNPETPLRAYRVNEFGNVETNDGVPIEALTPNRGFGLPLPRSAQIANFRRGEDMRGAEAYPMLRKDAEGNIQFVESPIRSGRKISLSSEDWKGTLPDSASAPEGMSYQEAKEKGLLNPVWDKSRPFTALDSSYQIPLPKGVGLARVLDESDPRTQAAITAQAKAEARIAADTTIVKPAFDRKYTITPGRIAGIESPQYAQYMDLTPNVNDTNAGWKENISGVVPKGVIEGAYLPVTVTPRPVNAEGKKGWLINNQIYTTESGREVRGDKAVNYVNVPLNLDSVATSYLPKSKREELELKGFSSDEIDAWVEANPNLARDNALANAKILIDGQYYNVTPQATAPEFDPAAGGNYLQAVNRSEHRGARIDLPFKAGKNISEPTPEWIAEQAAKGNLAFNPDDYISPEDKVILHQKEVYDAGYEEPTDILGAINRTQQKKNRIDAVISNRKQRAMNNLNEQVGSVVDGNYTTLSPGMKVFNRDILSNPEDLSTLISEDFIGPVQLIRDVQTPVNKTFKGWQNYSNYLGDEIARASAAHNAIIGIEDAPEIVIKREGSPQQLEAFLSTANSVLGMETKDDSFRYRNNPDEKLTASVVGSLPIRYLPYEQAQELNETKLYHPNDIKTIAANRDLTPAQVKSLENARLLPAYRTQQKVELSTVPTSNVMNLGRVIPFPEEVITTQQIIPAGNQVVDIANNSVAIVPSSSEKYQYRSGANANDDPWNIVDNSALGMMGGMGFDGGSIPGDDIPRQVRTNVQQRVQAEPNVRTSRTQSPNTPIEPDVRMTGMKIPKWAIPATLGAVWLGLAANARRQQDEERRQQQGVGIR